MVLIKDQQNWQKASEKLRYFEIGDKPCRALAFDKSLLGTNRERLHEQNVFVKFPKDMKISH
jgi:hypothetical protein